MGKTKWITKEGDTNFTFTLLELRPLNKTWS